MPWEKVKPIYTRRDNGTESWLKVKEYLHDSTHSHEFRGALSALAFLALQEIHQGKPWFDPGAPLRIALVHDEANERLWGLVPDPDSGVLITRGREFSAYRLTRVFGRHLRGGGYRVSLVPQDGALTFIWPPDDMRTAILPEAIPRHKKETPNGTPTE